MSSLANDAADTDPANALQRLLEQVRPLYQIDQVLIGYKNTFDQGTLVKIMAYELAMAGPYGKERPTLFIRWVTLKTIENDSFGWSIQSTSQAYELFIARGWALWSGDYSQRKRQAVALLDGGDIQALNAELLALQSGEEQAATTDQTALLAKGSKAHFEVLVASVDERRNEIRLQTGMVARRIEEQTQAMHQLKDTMHKMLAVFNQQIKRLYRAITTIELYMGIDEELHQLQEGPSAPAEEPISFRQLCLFMDEEIAIRIGFDKAKEFDFQTIEQFDDWLLQPGNLDYLLPEQRGIVVLRPRRFQKQYSHNAIINHQLNEENLSYTYFLIRDGANVYRIFTRKLTVQDRLFPRKTELAAMFDQEQQSIARGRQEAYEDSVYAYRTRAAFLQGLLSRTSVFGPLARHINLFALDERTESMIRFIYDDDEALLSDGRPAFELWQRNLNASIQPGSRVLLTGWYEKEGRWAQEKNFINRLFYSCNEYNAPPLPTAGLYLVENPPSIQQWGYYDKAEKELCIKHNPGEEIGVRGWTYQPHERKNRISWAIRRTDSFLLHYDAIRLDDVAYYLHSRLHRSQYLEMLPVLETILEEKAAERQLEAPFVQLVLDEAVRKKITTSRDAVEEALTWWKTKNKWKRSVTVDDAKALRMMLRRIAQAKIELPCS